MKVKAREFNHYNINGYHFWTTKLEVSRSLAATTNNEVVTIVSDADGHITN
jgi:hypothetical protein